MIVYLVLVLFGLLIYFWKSKTSKPSKFPPGPPRYPIVGSVPFITPPNQKPNVFWGVCQLQKQYGDIFGMYIGGLRYCLLRNTTNANISSMKTKKFQSSGIH